MYGINSKKCQEKVEISPTHLYTFHICGANNIRNFRDIHFTLRLINENKITVHAICFTEKRERTERNA